MTIILIVYILSLCHASLTGFSSIKYMEGNMTLTPVIPFRFYEVRTTDEGLTLNDIGQRFKVSPERIEREGPDQGGLLAVGEMLLIKFG